MKAKTIAIALLALAAIPALAGDQGKELQPVRLQYAMDVGADGRVIRLEPKQDLPEPVAEWLRSQLAGYRFLPAKVGGTPQPASTTLYVSLGPAVDAAGKAGYRINAVTTGPHLLRGMLPGRQPRVSGAAYFVIAYDASGKVTRAELDKDNDVVGGNEFRHWGVSLAKSFRIQPETIAGIGVPGEARLPIVFCLNQPCPTLAPPRREYGNDLNGAMLAKSVLSAGTPGEGG